MAVPTLTTMAVLNILTADQINELIGTILTDFYIISAIEYVEIGRGSLQIQHNRIYRVRNDLEFCRQFFNDEEFWDLICGDDKLISVMTCDFKLPDELELIRADLKPTQESNHIYRKLVWELIEKDPKKLAEFIEMIEFLNKNGYITAFHRVTGRTRVS